MKILVISSCTKSKQNKQCTARELYTGQQHKHVCNAVDNLRKNNYNVDFYILSALHGFVSENTMLQPYDYTFKGMSKKQINSETTHVKQQFNELVQNYDIVILLLGSEYLTACVTPGKTYNNVYAFTSNSTVKLIKCQQFVLTETQRIEFGKPNMISFKGVAFEKLAEQPLEHLLQRFN